jgi:hypothetical protein
MRRHIPVSKCLQGYAAQFNLRQFRQAVPHIACVRPDTAPFRTLIDGCRQMISGNRRSQRRQKGRTMGGYGSGPQSDRPTSDELLRLDLRRIFRSGLVAPGSGRVGYVPERWTCRGEPAGDIAVWWDDRQPAILMLRYRTRAGPDAAWEAIAEVVPIVTTPCVFGGERRWGGCPGCGRRVAVLYEVGGRFRCRACGRVAYSSTREDELGRLFRRAERSYAALGVPGANLLWGEGEYVARPAGMRRTTYQRHIAELREVAARANQVYLTELRRLATGDGD